MSSKSTPNDSTKNPLTVAAMDSENEALADSINGIEASFEEDEALLGVLKNAFEPGVIAPETHDDILEKALGQGWNDAVPLDSDFGEVSLEERQQAELLSLALDGRGAHPLADLATHLKVAFSPDAPLPISVERAVKGALSPSPTRTLTSPQPSNNSRWKRATTGAGIGLALAATFAFLWYPRSNRHDEVATTIPREYSPSRSLAPLFGEEFSRGNSTERMDRIVMARSRDLRHNRYLKWRVR
jgi:hypothetical protein